MKKTDLIRMAAFVAFPIFFSCTEKDQIIPGRSAGYNYRFEIADGETRATFTDEGVFWEDGDQVGVFAGEGASVAGNVNVSQDPKTIEFSSLSLLEEGTVVRAYYPYDADNTAAASTRIKFPKYQKGGSVSAMPMAGLPAEFSQGTTNGAIRFLNLGSIIDFRVFSSQYAGEQIKSITFTATAGGSVSGKAAIDLTQVSRTDDGVQVPELTWLDGSASVTLTQEAVVAADKDAAAENHLYMIIAPGTYSATIAIVTGTATYSFNIADIQFKRNGLRRFNMDLSKSTALRGGVFSIENDVLKTYLDRVPETGYDPNDYSYTYMTNDIYGGNTSTTNRTDWPRPVPVSWSNPTSGNSAKVVYVYNDSAMTAEELSVSVDKNATSAQVYNLIPNRTYYYKVVNGNDATPVATGVFSTTGRRRMLKVGGDYGKGYANNCRDFGGQKTQDGRRIKYGKIFRGSNMDLIFPPNDRDGNNHPDAKAVLKDYLKVGLDVDLRKSTSNNSNTGKGENYLYDALQLGNWHTTKSFNSWGDLSSKTNMQDILSKVFSAVNQNKTVYIHCMVGADRTGYLCMLLEAILGIEQGWCDVDYELTSLAGAVSDGGPRTRTGTGNYYYLSTKDHWGHVIVQGVDFIQTMEGDTFQAKAINYVVGTLGFTRNDILNFQNNMLEENN